MVSELPSWQHRMDLNSSNFPVIPQECCVVILCLRIEIQGFHPNPLIQALSCS